ncbi:NTE family protein [Frondihabitans australicus]|uniref:NTE family protein n=2 Tax=Frondihabitans australicus TaxID=386892 RepID=A0A495IHI5_9MICO|nr:NTE family protein [Frondihabitans australicus]
MLDPVEAKEKDAGAKFADLVLEGGGVKGIGLAGAVTTLARDGYRFPRIGGTSAGAIVACLVAVFEQKNVGLDTLEEVMKSMTFSNFEGRSWAQRVFGPVGNAAAVLAHQGVYSSDYLETWLGGILKEHGVETFGDLRLDDPGADANLPDERKYRLVVHASDLTRKCLVRIPWDLPQYLCAPDASPEERRAAIDSYRLVDAVRASMSIPWFFRPFLQRTATGSCTWVDGGLLENFPVTVFDRTDGRPNRWPTFGVKLSSRPGPASNDRTVLGNIAELKAVASTTLGQWNRYVLTDDGVDARTVWVDTDGISATEFHLSGAQQDTLYANGTAAADRFLTEWRQMQAPKVTA